MNFRGIATIIGPVRFSEEMRVAERELTLAGFITLNCGTFVYDETDPDVIARLNAAHEDVGKLHHIKIRMSSVVVLVTGRYKDQEYYIGQSTQADIDIAREARKPILMWHILGGEYDKLERALSSLGV